MANDPVLQRSMFQKQGPAVAPSVGLGTGIGSVTTPDQNAQALRSMFQPTVSIGMPTEMLQQGQPVQSFQEGGLARLLPQYDFRNRNFRLPPSYLERTDPQRFEAERPAREAAAEEARLRAEARLEEQRARYAPEQERYRAMEEARRAGVLATERARSFDIDDAEARSLTPDARRRLEDDRIVQGEDTLIRPARPGSFALPQSGARQRALAQVGQYPEYEPEIRSRYQEELRTGERAQPLVVPLPRPRPENLVPAAESPAAPVQEAPPPPPPPVAEDRKPPREDTLQLTLKEIKAERAAERRENALLALMQAGFAIAGGRSPNALSNIGAGGQAGIGAFAAMERASREDAAARRRDAIQLASAERQYALAERQLERDPEAVRTYAILGGYKPGDPKEAYQAAVQRGFNITQSKEGPKLAATIINNPLSTQYYSPQDLKDLAEYAKRGIIGMGGQQPREPQTFRLDELPRSR